MSFLSCFANPASFSYLLSCAVESANKSLSTHNYGERFAALLTAEHAPRIALQFEVNFRSQCADDNFALACVCRYVSRLFARSQLRGLSGARRHSVFCFAFRAPLWGLGSSQNKFGEPRQRERLYSNFFRAPPRKQTFGTWEPGPLAKLRPV